MLGNSKLYCILCLLLLVTFSVLGTYDMLDLKSSFMVEGFKVKKLDTGEEFLINKKNPLVVPPDFDELPIPNSDRNNSNNNENSEKNLKEILDIKDETNSSSPDNPKKTLDLEESILEKIN